MDGDSDLGRRALRVVFGDVTGAYVFLAAMVFFGVYWSLTFFSTDTLTLANTLVAVSEGHLDIQAIEYGPSSLAQPGTHVVDGKLYGRNYGQVVLAAPVLLAIRGLALVADVRLLLVGVWCLGVLALLVRIGECFDRREQAAVLGSGVALLLFVFNAALATRIPTRLYPLLALQVGSMVAAAMVAVVLYRWIGQLYGDRAGLLAGVGTAVATPVGFWASIPKRHSLTTLLVVLVLYSFYRSRAAEDDGIHRQFRALSYAWVALAAWVHGGEAFVLLLALVVVDFPTARDNAPRNLAYVGLVFVLALVPFLLTNAVVTGNPVEPPRMAPGFDGSELPPGVDPSPGVEEPGGKTPGQPDPGTPDQPAPGTTDPDRGSEGGTETPGPPPETTPAGEQTPARTTSASGTTGGTDPGGPSSGTGPGGGAGPLSIVTGVVGAILGVLVAGADAVGAAVNRFWGFANKSRGIVTDVDRMTDVFLRSGYVPGLLARKEVPVNLAVLESMPVLGVLAVVPILGIRRVSSWLGGSRSLSPVRQTDVLGVAVLALFALVYLPKLPIHHMYTVRYLHPIYPVGAYFLFRVPIVRNAVTGHARIAVGSFAATVLAGVPAYLVAIQSLGLVRSEAVQLYALCALVLAVAVAFWGVLSAAQERIALGRPGAALLGIAAGATTVYLLVGGVELFARGTDAALPIVRFLGESIRAVTG